MKKFAYILACGLAALMFASCGGPELLAIYPVYIGETVTSTHHEFEKEDFYVLASYNDGTDKLVTNFDMEVEGMDAGYYLINIEFEDMDNPVYVPIEAKIYPSDFEEKAESGTEDHSHE